MKNQIGLIGIGLVGTALAENLISAGFPVIGFDIDPDKCATFEKMGGKAVSSPLEVAEKARNVFLSLMNTDIVQKVLTGSEGLLHSGSPPTHVIDTTTGDPDETIKIAYLLKKREYSFWIRQFPGPAHKLGCVKAL